ncbi:MAG: 6-phosphofructokinase [Candidatus Eremiobacteraeota bacterium]|nr:6-phosphofructokinase [Candidatus Eremiobacteraeota bacterium]MBV8432912.1 6-phosphofructokinase [Candidatus Eremiobacteraeota bacterium]MBV8723416.1 6-phosphofructokinase [Candidatus Eremiobacteraeota bacterium]
MTETLGILVGGGPAPGINGVIASAAMEAFNYGLRVVGIYDGYRDLAAGRTPQTVELTFDHVSRIHTSGGSILRTSRTNPARDEATLQRCIESIERLGLRYLVCIGGDDTTFGAARIAARTNGAIGVATVPKTIDNDLPLPDNAPTFGFETARSVGAGILESLMEDARTTARWYVVVCMGRKSGALALGMCKAAGSTLAVLPEEFPENTGLSSVVDTIVGAIVKRRSVGRKHGVAVVAEGIAERLSPQAFEHLEAVPRDSFGNIALADIPLGMILRDGVRKRLEEIGVDSTVHAKDIGYELRCAKPVPFDVDYTRTLGFGAVRYLIGGGSGALIALSGGHVSPMSLEDLLDPETGRIRTRQVDSTTEAYRVARDYMVRLEPPDFEGERLANLAAQTSLDPARFKAEFEKVALP